jgi:hypothetical protein
MYNEKDIHTILKRAIQLQGEKEGFLGASGSYEDLSLEEIEQIARESGVSPEFVRQAVIEYDGVPVEEPLLIDTGNRRVTEILGFAKGEINKKTWTELIAEIEKQLNTKGSVKRRPDRLTWVEDVKGVKKIFPLSAPARVDISLKSGQRSIRLLKKLPMQIFLRGISLFGFGMAAFLLSLILSGQGSTHNVPPILIFSTLLALGGIGVWKLAERFRESSKQRYKDLVESLQTIVTRNHQASDTYTSSEKVIDTNFEKEESKEEKVKLKNQLRN